MKCVNSIFELRQTIVRAFKKVQKGGVRENHPQKKQSLQTKGKQLTISKAELLKA